MATSASEIANYRGDASAALGSSTAGIAPVIFGETNADRVNERADWVAAANLQKNANEYNRKIQARNDFFKLLESKQLQLNTLLPKDRDEVRSKYLNPIRDMLIADPNAITDPNKSIILQQKLQDFNEAQNYGAHRYGMIVGAPGVEGLNQQIATEVDPETRAKMIAHRDQMMSKGLFDVVTPFQKTLDISDKMYVNPTAVDLGETQDLEGDKLTTVKRSRTDIADFKKGALFNYTSNPDKTIKNQMDIYKQQFNTLPDDKKIETINQWNETRQRAMDDADIFDPNDPRYIAPYTPSIIKDADGNERVVLNETPDRLVLGASMTRFYKDTKTPSEKISEIGVDMANKRANTAQTEYETKYKIPIDVAYTKWKMQQTKAEIDKTRAETIGINKKNTEDQATAKYTMGVIGNILNPTNYGSGLKAEDNPAFQSPATQLALDYANKAKADSKTVNGWISFASATPKLKATLLNKYGAQGVITKQQFIDEVKAANPYKGEVIAATNSKGQFFSALGRDALKIIGGTKDGKELIPSQVALNTIDPDNPYIVAVVPQPDKVVKEANTKGVMVEKREKVPPVIQRVQPFDLVQGAIKNTYGTLSGLESKTPEAIATYITNVTGEPDPQKASVKYLQMVNDKKINLSNKTTPPSSEENSTRTILTTEKRNKLGKL